jgi:hypothetical protein
MSYRPLQPFAPFAASTKALAVTNSSANAQLPANTRQVMLTTILNDAMIFVEFGGTSVSAVVPSGSMLGGTPINGGDAQMFSVPPNATYVAAITSTGTATLYITPGEGL